MPRVIKTSAKVNASFLINSLSFIDIFIYYIIIIYLYIKFVNYYTYKCMNLDMTKEELLKKFGLNVKFARMKKGLTQEQLSEIMNIHPTYLARIETGRINMSLGKVLELAKVLRVDINKLLYIE